MRKRKIVRLQLIALVAVLLLVLYRVFEGPPRPKGAVVFTDVEPEQLKHAAFTLEAPDTFVVTATGSFEPAATPPSLAAYGWVLRREDRSVAWVMTAERAVRGRGTLAEATDTLHLAPGTYDVYYTSYGNRRGAVRGRPFWERFTRPESSWRNDSRKWSLVLRSLTDARDRFALLKGEEQDVRAPRGEGLLWSTAPMQGRRTEEFLFDVQRPANLRIYAVGEIDNRQMDYGWIENVLTGARVWEMTDANTEPAGGWEVNRRYEGTLALAPAIYRAVFTTDARQSSRGWVGNPPFDPAAWGMSLFASDAASARAMASFDPWQARRPLVRLTEAGSGALYIAQFEVRRPVRLIAYGTGEIGGSPYDYAWIKNNDRDERLWEMTRETSHHAGGDDNNRYEMAFLSFEPGTYSLYYQTDDSHAYDDWHHEKPDHPDRWGVALFPVPADFDTSAVRILGVTRQHDGEKAAAPGVPEAPAVAEGPPPPPLGSGTRMLRATGLGGETRKEIPFSLTDQATLHIYALGEISLSGRYDYGWIERADNGEIVWEMTWQNTTPAGGDDRNRLYDGVVELPRGAYVVHYRTDFSHHFGDFGDRTPANPSAWGITIEKL